MSAGNPYHSPREVRETTSTNRNDVRLTPKQTRWITQSRYSLRLLYAVSAFFTLAYIGQLVFVVVVFGTDSTYGISSNMRNQTILLDILRIAVGGAITLSFYRFDRSLGHVLRYDAAGASVNRAIRMGRNAMVALGAGIMTLTFVAFAVAYFVSAG